MKTIPILALTALLASTAPALACEETDQDCIEQVHEECQIDQDQPLCQIDQDDPNADEVEIEDLIPPEFLDNGRELSDGRDS